MRVTADQKSVQTSHQANAPHGSRLAGSSARPGCTRYVFLERRPARAGPAQAWQVRPDAHDDRRARSGKERSTIIAYYEDGPNLVTLAMNGSGESEPAWW